MGSFTPGASAQIMKALFNSVQPTTGTGTDKNTPATTIPTTGASAFRIYNAATATTNEMGIFSAGTDSVRHRIDLIKSGALTTGLTEANFASNNTLTATGVATGFADYAGYTGMSQVSSGNPTGNHLWTSWTLGAEAGSTGKYQVSNTQQIGFPTCSASGATNNIIGFCLSAAGIANGTASNTTTGVAAAPASTTTILTTTPAAQVIFAYGDLSTGRFVNNNDTPVFTLGAIIITLD